MTASLSLDTCPNCAAEVPSFDLGSTPGAGPHSRFSRKEHARCANCDTDLERATAEAAAPAAPWGVSFSAGSSRAGGVLESA